MPLLLENVCYLSIHVGSFRDMLVPGMVSTFQGMCNLSTLEIMSDPEFFEPKTDVSESVAYFFPPLFHDFFFFRSGNFN
ncbi:unnamed protein product [Prunus brigantina]